MFLLLKVWTLDEWADEWAEFALVEVSPESASVIVTRMDQAEVNRQMNSSFTCAEYWDYGPQWLQFDDTLAELLGDSPEVVVLQEKPAIAEDQLIRQDCTRMCIAIAGSEPAEVQWRSYIKHTGVQMETASVPRQVFEKIAGRAPVEKKSVEKKQEFFSAIRLSREDLTHATGRDCADLPDHVMQKIAERVGDGLFEGGAWEVIAEAAEPYLEEELC